MYRPLRLYILTLVIAVCTGMPVAAEPQSIVVDLGTYRGWWEIRAEDGATARGGECRPKRRCRPRIALEPGSYHLAFSREPQSAAIRFALTSGAITLSAGQELVEAVARTLRLKRLVPVTFALGGYKGPWGLAGWRQARQNGAFTASGGEDTISLVPLTTYGLEIGAGVSERLRIGLDGAPLLIDDKGAVKIAPGPPALLEMQTIDVAVYPKPLPGAPRASLSFTPESSAFAPIDAPAIVRLVQGSTYEIAWSSRRPGDPPLTFSTGKACNMASAHLRSRAGDIHVLPLRPSCQP